MRTIIYLAMFIASIGCASPRDSTRPQSDRGDNYLTWSGYDGLTNESAALYIWNGQPIGIGDAGIDAVISIIAVLPEGSGVLVFPKGYIGISRVSGSRAYLPPFHLRADEVAAAAEANKVRLIPSDRDQNGVRVPIPGL